MFLLLAGLALAEEPVEPPPAEPELLEDEIEVVPEGSHVTIEGTTYTVPAKYWLLPDTHYKKAVIKAKQLEICQPALDTCVEDTLAWQDRTYTALQECSAQFGSDDLLIQDLTGQVQELETQALISEDNLKRVRRNTLIAWGVTSALLVGGAVAVLATN